MNLNPPMQYVTIVNTKYCIFDKIHREYCVCDHYNIGFSNHKFIEFNTLEDASDVIHMIKSKYPDRDFVIKKITQSQNSINSKLDNIPKMKLCTFLKKNYHCSDPLPIINIISYYTDQKFLFVFSSNKRTKEIKSFMKTHLNERVFRLSDSDSAKVFFTNDIAKIICFKLVFDELKLDEIIDLEKMEYLNT